MNGEEISLKLGIDGSGFSQGVRSIKGQLQEFSETSGKAFFKGASAAKGFKAAIHEIAAESPVLGSALKLAISPIGGTIIAATALFGYFKNKIEETTKELDKLGDIAAESLGDMQDAIRKTNKEIIDLNRGFNEWLQNFADKHKDVTGGLKQQLDLMDSQSRVNDKLLAQEKEKALASVRMKEASGQITPYEAAVATRNIEQQYANRDYAAQLGGARARERVLGDTAESLYGQKEAARTQAIAAHADTVAFAANPRTADLPAEIEKLKKLRDSAKGQHDKSMDTQDALESMIREGQTGPTLRVSTGELILNPVKEAEANAKVMQQQGDLVRSYNAKIKKYQDEQDKREERLKDLKDREERLKKSADKLDDAWKSTADAALKAKQSMDELGKVKPFVAPVADTRLAGFAPTLQQIAGTRGPSQQAAQRAQTLESQIQQRIIQGDFSGATELTNQYENLIYGELAPEKLTGAKGPAGKDSLNEYYRTHGLSYETGRMVRQGGLNRLLHPGQTKDPQQETLDIWKTAITKDGKLRVKPELDN